MHVSYVHAKPGLHARWRDYELQAKDDGMNSMSMFLF